MPGVDAKDLAGLHNERRHGVGRVARTVRATAAACGQGVNFWILVW